MDTFFIRNRLSAYIDNQLPEEEARAVAAALDQDGALRAEYESMRAAVTLLRERGPVRAPLDFQARVMAAVEQQPRPGMLVQLRSALRQIPVEAVALAAAALIVVVVLARPGEDTAALSPPPPPDTKDGAAAPLDISPAPELSLPTALPSRPEPAPRASASASEKPTTAGTDLSKKAVPPVEDAYVAEWERQEPSALPSDTLSQGSGDDLQVTPTALYDGVQTGTASHQYRITMGDADVLYNLQQLAQSSGGRLLDTQGNALAPRTLTVEDNYIRVQVVVSPDHAEAVHAQLARLGARALAKGTPLFNAEYIAFVIEVSYMP